MSIKLIIQIPCYNEEKTLPLVVADIPKQIKGVDVIELQIIDDGSTDKTLEVAKQLGIHHIIKNTRNKGLGTSFRIGMESALKSGADILVNTDGDNQYPSSYIPDLIAPIINGEADMTIGNRQTSKIQHFSFIKKIFQGLGTWVTRSLAGDPSIKDAVSGFRAYSRHAMMELNITTKFSYVLDTTIQASHKRLKIANVDITTNAPTRPSRLFSNIFQHIRKSGVDIIRIYSMYSPLKVFLWLGLFFLAIGITPILIFLYDYFFWYGGLGKIQSLVLGAIFVIISFNCFALGVIGDLLAKNRVLIEYILKEMKNQKKE